MTPPTPAAAALLAVSPLRLLVRFVLAYLVLLLGLWLLRPLWLSVVARIARDLLLLASPLPRIWDVAWEHDWFLRVVTPLSPHPHGGSAPWSAFALVFPLATLLAAPGLGGAERLRRGAWILAGGVLLFGVITAANSAHATEQVLSGQGLVLYPLWRSRLHFRLAFWTWSLGAILYPLAASLYALAPLVPALAGGRGTARRGRHALLAALVGLPLALGLDQLASHRLRGLELEALVADVEPLNRDPGRYFAAVGDESLAAGKREVARRYYALALRYPQHASRAREGLERLRAGAQQKGD